MITTRDLLPYQASPELQRIAAQQRKSHAMWQKKLNHLLKQRQMKKQRQHEQDPESQLRQQQLELEKQELELQQEELQLQQEQLRQQQNLQLQQQKQMQKLQQQQERRRLLQQQLLQQQQSARVVDKPVLEGITKVSTDRGTNKVERVLAKKGASKVERKANKVQQGLKEVEVQEQESKMQQLQQQQIRQGLLLRIQEKQRQQSQRVVDLTLLDGVTKFSAARGTNKVERSATQVERSAAQVERSATQVGQGDLNKMVRIDYKMAEGGNKMDHLDKSLVAPIYSANESIIGMKERKCKEHMLDKGLLAVTNDFPKQFPSHFCPSPLADVIVFRDHTMPRNYKNDLFVRLCSSFVIAFQNAIQERSGEGVKKIVKGVISIVTEGKGSFVTPWVGSNNCWIEVSRNEAECYTLNELRKQSATQKKLAAKGTNNTSFCSPFLRRVSPAEWIIPSREYLEAPDSPNDKTESSHADEIISCKESYERPTKQQRLSEASALSMPSQSLSMLSEAAYKANSSLA